MSKSEQGEEVQSKPKAYDTHDFSVDLEIVRKDTGRIRKHSVPSLQREKAWRRLPSNLGYCIRLLCGECGAKKMKELKEKFPTLRAWDHIKR